MVIQQFFALFLQVDTFFKQNPTSSGFYISAYLFYIFDQLVLRNRICVKDFLFLFRKVQEDVLFPNLT